MYFQIFTVDVLLFIESFRDLWAEKEFHGLWGLAGPLGLAGRLHQLQTRTCCRNRIFRVQKSWSKQGFRVQCLWNVLKHQDTITLAPLLLPRQRVARYPIDFLQNQMCRYQRSVMFTCLLGSSAFIAIQHDPNLLYNTVSFNLCVCFVWPWIQIDWNGRSQWMQSFWELTTQIWVWFILGAGHQPFWIVTNLWQYFSTFLNCVWQYRKSVFLSFLSIMFSSGCSGWSTCSNVLEAQT